MSTPSYQINQLNPVTSLTGNERLAVDQNNGSGYTTYYATPAQLGGLFLQTAAELSVNVTPTNYAFPPGNAFRYGVDPTGVNDSTFAIQQFINASAWSMYNFPDGQDLWNGSGGACPVIQLPPGKYKVSGTIYLPAACTFRGTGHPANTTSHTRLIMNSTGLTPARVWTAGAAIPAFARINAGNGYNFINNGAAGVSGSSVPAWPTGAGSVTDGTVTWTFNAANTSGDNRNTPMIKFGRGTQPRVGAGPNGVLADSGLVVTIQELEFWGMSIGGTFSNPLSGSGYAVGDYPLGGTLACDVDMADSRVVDCVFQSNPASLWGNNIQSPASAIRGDGFTGNRGIGMFFENCEFDAATAHVFMQNCYLNLWFKECLFFNTSHFYGTGCTGTLNYINCYFEYGALIGAPFVDMGLTYGANNFTYVNIKGSIVEPPSNYPWVYLHSVGCAIDISQNSLMTAATLGGIFVNGANAGRISSNVLNNQGYDAAAGTGISNFPAAINVQNCQNLLIANNNVTANSAATYNGFGILTSTNGGTASTGNYITGNAVTAPYNGATYNGQSRFINIASGDILGVNYNAHTSTTAQTAGPSIVAGALGVNNNVPPAQSTGWGTPTGATVTANFPGASATLVQTAETLAEIITQLKSVGFLGS